MDDRDALTALGRLARDGTNETVTPEHDAAERARWMETMGRPRAQRKARWDFAVAASLVLATLMLAAVVLWPERRLKYAVEGAALAEGGYVAASAESAARIRFADGSMAAVQPGSSMRVMETHSAGARLVLEEGRAELSFAKRTGARWSVEAGPFSVIVTGTRFNASWSRADERLQVELHEGSVVVRGPLLQDGLSLRAGQTVIASLREGRVQLADGRTDAGAGVDGIAATAAAPDSSAAPAEQTVAGPDEPSPAGSAALVASSRTSAELAPSWSKWVAAGDFASVLAEADQLGVDAVLENGSLDDLLALADAARYGRRGDLARRALLTLRRRSPRSAAAKSAAFLLGRLTDDGGSPAAAIAWYEAYLSESPNGTFAAEAAGRRMRAVYRSQGAAAARALAEDYLRKYPTGPYAPAAREILGR
jgi:hypothetical protein